MDISAILEGDERVAAQLMRDIEDGHPSGLAAVCRLYAHAGRAHVIGVTGAPGTGKSTLTDRLIQAFRKQGRSVGVVAVDPSSPFTGGAILGDRVRMQRHSTDRGVFIRSLATRGQQGGLARCTHDIVTVMDAMGKEIVLVETVGVGQDEVDIFRMAHTNLVVVAPGMGDGLQAVKAGLLETGHIFVVNKSDIPGAAGTASEMQMTLERGAGAEGNWVAPVVPTVARDGRGVDELMEQIRRHADHRRQSGEHRRQRFQWSEIHLTNLLRETLVQQAVEDLQADGSWQRIVADLAGYRTDPHSALDSIMKILRGSPPRSGNDGSRAGRTQGPPREPAGDHGRRPATGGR
jgi:LAO/AO transport system kinase